MSRLEREGLIPVDEGPGLRRRVGRKAPRGIVALVAAWLGAVLFFGLAVAPSVFAVLARQADAGALVGRLLPILFISGFVVGVMLLFAAARLDSAARVVRRALGGAGLVMVVCCGLAQGWVAPELARIRTAAGALETRPPDDPLRRAFGRLHGMSVLLLGIAWLGGATAVVVSAFVPGRRS
ncbi:MAG TPA: DUF4149 domain-containing protein [Gemmatimonadaceae bacterium]|nr:DUF4149 domain-containing protein [Gemmatimonadaceae bacterium]